MANYLRLDCTSAEKHWLVHIQTLRRDAPILNATHVGETQRALASDLLWQDFGHYGDWQYPASSAAIGSKYGWEVIVLQTVLADDVYMLARKAPQGEESCLPVNHFGTCLINEHSLPLVHAVSGRVLLVKSGKAHSERSFSFESYTAEQFVDDVQCLGKDTLAAASFHFDCDARVERIPGTLPWCEAALERVEATYVRLTCTKNAGGQLSLVAEPCNRVAFIEIVTPCTFKEMRQQLARGLFWHDFGHDSDWRHPYSKSHISTKYGWEVGLLGTKLGDDIGMLARKPPTKEQRCLPFNPFAMEVMHDGERPYVQFVNGSVLMVRVDKELAAAQSKKGTFTFQSLDVAAFCDAYKKLAPEVRAGISLTVRGVDCPDILHACDSDEVPQLEGSGDISDDFVTPVASTAARAVGGDMDGWEWVVQAQL